MKLAKTESNLENTMYKMIKMRDDLRLMISKLCDQEEKATEQINFIEEFLNGDSVKDENLFS